MATKRNKIELYDTRSYTSRFMGSGQLNGLLKEDFDRFFIVRVEDMYPHVKHPVPPSRATTHSCLFLKEGEANMNIGNERYTIHPGEMLFVPAGQVFSFPEHDSNRGYLCNFREDIVVGKFGNREILKDFEFLRVWGNPLICFNQATADFVGHIFSRMQFDYSQNGLSHLDLIQPYLITILCETARAYQPMFSTTQTPTSQIANRFIELIFEHFRSRHLVTDYASLLNVTPNHLNKMVKSVTGKSPARWIDEAIVMEAKVLLSRSDIPIGAIASQVGIDDQSYFTRLFKRYERKTPTQYRRMIEPS